MSKFRIYKSRFVKPEHARKDIDFTTNEPYNPDIQDHYSEWALSVAAHSFKEGELITEYQLRQEVAKCKLQQEIDKLVELGLVAAVWNEKTQSVGYVIPHD